MHISAYFRLFFSLQTYGFCCLHTKYTNKKLITELNVKHTSMRNDTQAKCSTHYKHES